MKIWDLFDFADLERELQEGYVRNRWHPAGPLIILNYTGF